MDNPTANVDDNTNNNRIETNNVNTGGRSILDVIADIPNAEIEARDAFFSHKFKLENFTDVTFKKFKAEVERRPQMAGHWLLELRKDAKEHEKLLNALIHGDHDLRALEINWGQIEAELALDDLQKFQYADHLRSCQSQYSNVMDTKWQRQLWH